MNVYTKECTCTIRDMLRDPVCAVGTQGTNTIVGESILFIRELYKEKKTGIHGQFEII